MRTSSLPLLVRSRRLLLSCLLALGGCEPPTADPPVEGASAPPVRAPREAGLEDASSGLASIDVGGLVVDDHEDPVVGRPVDVVDARGTHLSLMTDEGGGFWAMGIVAPYDVLVAPAPSGAIVTPLAYLGLTRQHPRLEVFERGGPVTRAPGQALRVGVVLPPCLAAGGACWVSVTSASAGGHGGTAASYTAGTTSGVYDLEHAFDDEQGPLASGEKLTVHVLAGDARGTWYAYGWYTDIEVHPGESRDLGMVTPRPVAVTEPVVIAGRAPGLPAGWQWTLASQLELPGGAMLPLRYDWATSSVLRLPRLEGASLHVDAWAQEPNSGDGPVFHRSAHARSGALALTAPGVTLDLVPPPAPVLPGAGGTISAHDDGLVWQDTGPALHTVVVVDAARGHQRFRAFTAEPALPFARLVALGLGRLDPGEHVVDRMSTPGLDVDALTEPDEATREDRSGFDRPACSSYERFAFTVTP